MRGYDRCMDENIPSVLKLAVDWLRHLEGRLAFCIGAAQRPCALCLLVRHQFHMQATDAESDACAGTGFEVPHSRMQNTDCWSELSPIERPQPNSTVVNCRDDDHAMFVMDCPAVGVPIAWHDARYGPCHAYEDLNYGEP